MLNFEFDVCEDCYNAMGAMSEAAALMEEETPVNVLGDLCVDCAEGAQKAMQGGSWN